MLDGPRRRRIRSVSRMVLYVAAALMAMALLVSARLFTGSLEGPRWALVAFILATLSLLGAMPAGYALAMAR